MKKALYIKTVGFESGHALQGSIEHIAKLLMAQGRGKFGENVISDFDIEYFGKMLIGLVTLREHMEIIEIGE